MRTIVAPLSPEVEAELDALDGKRADIARRYIRRLALEPLLGARFERGLLTAFPCRRIYFDIDNRPDDLFGNRPAPRRRGDQALGEGPKWRIVYWVRDARKTGVRLIVILAIGAAHPASGSTVYEKATSRLVGLLQRKPR